MRRWRDELAEALSNWELDEDGKRRRKGFGLKMRGCLIARVPASHVAAADTCNERYSTLYLRLTSSLPSLLGEDASSSLGCGLDSKSRRGRGPIRSRDHEAGCCNGAYAVRGAKDVSGEPGPMPLAAGCNSQALSKYL